MLTLVHCSNHGTFYYNQLAALKILLGDFPGAKNVTDTYFRTLYMSQIVKGGEQVGLSMLNPSPG